MSETRPKSKIKWWLVIPALAFLLILALGPSVLLNIFLGRIVPTETGLTVSFQKARAGFFFRSAQVEDLRLTDERRQAPVFAADRIDISGFSILNLIRLIQSPEELPARPLFLASRVLLEGVEQQLNRDDRYRCAAAEIAGLYLTPNAARPSVPALFEKFEIRDFVFSADGYPELFKVAQMDARNLGPEILGGLTVRDLAVNLQDPSGEGPALNFQVWGLTLGGLRLDSLMKMRSESGLDLAAWWLLSGCDTLDLAQAVVTRQDREALNIRSARFDQNSAGKDGPVTFTRRLNFSADLTALVSRPDDIFWRDLRDFTGDKFQAEMNLALNYDRQSGQAELTEAVLEAPDLGRLELTAKLGGVTRVEPHLSLSQLLFSAAESGWRWEGLTMAFHNQGFMGNFYRHLSRTVFRGLPNSSPVDNIMTYFIDPWALNLAREQGLANLPALLSETEAFLEQPDKLTLRSQPQRPVPLRSLANPDKYDIIEKLRLTVQVNERAPIAVAVASGVFQENLPLAPKPMENFFIEEDI